MKGSFVIKDRINKLLKEKNMSINKACSLGGLTTSTLNSMLNDKSEYCSIKTVIKFCQGIGISLYDFFQDERFKELDIED